VESSFADAHGLLSAWIDVNRNLGNSGVLVKFSVKRRVPFARAGVPSAVVKSQLRTKNHLIVCQAGSHSW
jgi:hypothetical protein